MENARISHYELRRLLGRGGMGEVYEAFDLNTKRAVALKFVAPDLAAEPEAFRRFESEALNAAALNHPHIATLYEFEPEGNRPFIAMEFVAGQNLRDRINAGPFDIHEALGVARDVAAALAYAHRRNIVHRDIKPENLMFDEEGRIKVMDFGLARALLATRLTVTGTSLGTPSYMSPESVAGTTGPPSDVFALGLVMVEMITGRQVFLGESPLSVMFAIANTEAPPLRQLRPDAPEAVEALAARLLDKDPERRIDAASAAKELAELTGVRLSQLALGAPAEPRTGNAPGPAPVFTSTATTAAIPRPSQAITEAMERPPAPRRRVPPWMIGVALAAAVTAGLWLIRSSSGRERRQEAVTLNNQAHAALQRGDLAEAERLVAEALERDPRYGEALFNRAVIYRGKGNLDSAAALYTALTKSHARDKKLVAMANYNLGDIDLDSGAPDQAADHFAKSFAYDSSRWESYNNLGFALISANRPADAVPLLERGIARFPGTAPLYKNAALALAAVDRESDALAQLDRALTRDPGLTAARGLRARLKARRGDRAGALADWKIYVASSPPPDAKDRADIEQELAERGVIVSANPSDGSGGR